MKDLSLIIGLFLGLVMTGSSCFFVEEEACIFPAGPEETRQISLDPMDGIFLSIPARLVVRQGDRQAVTVTGPRALLDNLDDRVRNGVWTVQFSRCVRDYQQLLVEVSLPVFRELGISGAGEIFSENILAGDELHLFISGAGDIDLGVDVAVLDLDISGSGRVFLEGLADRFDYQLSGQGSVKAFALTTLEAYIRISGAGNVDITATDRLDVRISGTGTVRYRGQPERNVRISGVGEVVDAN